MSVQHVLFWLLLFDIFQSARFKMSQKKRIIALFSNPIDKKYSRDVFDAFQNTYSTFFVTG